jgi:hypothetical protein
MTSINNNTAGSSFLYNGMFSIDLYVAAGGEVSMSYGFGVPVGTGSSIQGYLAGHLIYP